MCEVAREKNQTWITMSDGTGRKTKEEFLHQKFKQKECRPATSGKRKWCSVSVLPKICHSDLTSVRKLDHQTRSPSNGSHRASMNNSSCSPFAKADRKGFYHHESSVQYFQDGVDEKIPRSSSFTGKQLFQRHNKQYTQDTNADNRIRHLRNDVEFTPISQESSTIYLQNPTLDPRFQRLLAQLVPNAKAASNDITPTLHGNVSRGSNQESPICFHDICLNHTCLTIYKLMRVER